MSTLPVARLRSPDMRRRGRPSRTLRTPHGQPLVSPTLTTNCKFSRHNGDPRIASKSTRSSDTFQKSSLTKISNAQAKMRAVAS